MLPLAWLLAASRLAAAVPSGASPVIAHDPHHGVTYHGLHESKVEAFLSIPYAHDTSGPHRFKPPRPYTPARGSSLNATAASPNCPQQTGYAPGLPFALSNVTEISEDCLRLNIHRPTGTCAGDGLPVMVYIHGGGFNAGSKDEINVQPPGLILESVTNGHPVLVVNINYRLGVFGFAKSDALAEEGSLNAGIRDQRLALEWVRDNIAAFGGDDKRVTIFGQSSGGLSVGIQILAYGGAKPAPFQQGICESQALEPGITGKFTDGAMQDVVKRLKACNATTDIQSKATLKCLRSLSMTELLDAQLAGAVFSPATNLGDIWLPTVDGDILPDAPSKLIEEGRFNNITTMIGWCQGDIDVFIDSTVRTPNDTLNTIAGYLPDMPISDVHHLLSMYPSSDFSHNIAANLTPEFYRTSRIIRDVLMTCQPLHLGQALASKSNTIYLYDQNQTILAPALQSAVNVTGLGVVHTSEFAYIFGNLSHYDVDGLPFHPTPADYALKDRQSRSWSMFAALGQPSVPGHAGTLKGWTPAFPNGKSYGKEEIDVFVIGGPGEGLSAFDGPRSVHAIEVQKLRERCAFINSPEIIKGLRY